MKCPSCGFDSAVDRLPVGRILRARRLELGLTIAELIAESGIERPPSWISRLEISRTTAPALPELVVLCVALGLDATAAAFGQTVLTGS